MGPRALAIIRRQPGSGWRSRIRTIFLGLYRGGGEKLKRRHFYFQLAGDAVRLVVICEFNRCADLDCDFSGLNETLALYLVESFDLHGQNRNTEACGEQSDAAAEGMHFSVRRARAFGEDKHAVAAVGEIAGEGEALAKSRALRQGKDIEECDHQRIARSAEPAPQEKYLARRISHL